MRDKKKITLVRDLAPYRLQKLCVAAIGNFDGLHLGHIEILKKVVALAEQTGLTPTVITFDPLPIQFFQPALPGYQLTSLAEKIRLLEKIGIEQVICLRFNQGLATLSPAHFVEQVLVKAVKLKYLIVGEDFRFGYQRQGDIKLLNDMGPEYGFEVHPQLLVCMREDRISSTGLREALLRGDCTRANQLLGRFFSVTRRVIRGAKRGAQWGTPTANLILPPSQRWIKGVFITRVTIEEEESYFAVTNCGFRPTVDGSRHIIESHLLDFSGDLYGKKITVEFFHKLRDEKRFEDLHALQKQIEEDKKQAKNRIDQWTTKIL